MKIGITYDLRDEYLKAGYTEDETAEFDRIDTIDAIDESLRSLGHETVRIGHVKNLTRLLARDERWDLVFNIAEGLYGYSREAVIPALLEAYRIPCTFSDPLVLAASLHKGITKRIIRDLGLPTPAFHVVAELADIGQVNLPYPLFAKPVSEGTGKGIDAKSKVENSDQLAKVCSFLLEKYRQPVLVETFLPGREVTVGITGTGDKAEVVGVMEVILLSGAEKEVYSYINKEQCEKLVEYKRLSDSLAEDAKSLALKIWRGLNCRDAGRIDLRADSDGRLSFMEINPLAGLHPQHSDLPIICTQNNIPYIELIRRIVQSAQKRM